MISYELAKRIKEAGFPQTFTNPTHFIEPNSDAKITDVVALSPEKFISIPTLEEAIEACGSKLALSEDGEKDDKWLATRFGEGLERITQAGSSPLEAVLNLWLAINNK